MDAQKGIYKKIVCCKRCGATLNRAELIAGQEICTRCKIVENMEKAVQNLADTSNFKERKDGTLL